MDGTEALAARDASAGPLADGWAPSGSGPISSGRRRMNRKNTTGKPKESKCYPPAVGEGDKGNELNVERRADGPGNAGQRQGEVPPAAKKVHRNGPRHNAGQDGLADGPPDDYDQVKLPDGADLRNEVKGDTQTSGSEGHQPPCAVAVGETAHH